MTQRLEFYKCEVCGNFVQVILEGSGELVCCGQPMTLVQGKQGDETVTEKHVPIFTKDDNGNEIVKVGIIDHPMNNEHYIMFIEAVSKDKSQMQLKYLSPGDIPMSVLDKNSNHDNAYAYCNLHGLWEGKSD